MQLRNALEDFYFSCEADGLSDKTLTWYKSTLGAFCNAFRDETLQEIKTKAIRGYIVGLWRSDYSRETVKGHIRSLHKFWKWAAVEYSFPNPMTGIKYPAQPKPNPRPVRLEDIEAMFEAAGKTTMPERDQFILAFLFDTGCRAEGLCKLDLEHLDIRAKKARVTEKGNKTRVVYFKPVTRDLLVRWLKVRKVKDHSFVVCGDTGHPLTTNGLYQLTKRLARKAGVTGRYSPHGFRDAFAEWYLRKGGDIYVLSKILGHTSVQVTQDHYGLLKPDDIERKHRKYSPVGLVVKSKKKGGKG